VIVDDVFTQGGTVKAMQSILMALPKTERVAGIFLAKTVWPTPGSVRKSRLEKG
jgi:predicted amidophosphoribosyltransferase